MVTLNANLPDPVTAGPPPLVEWDFSVSATERPVIITPGIATPLAADDRLMETQTGAVIDHEADIATTPIAGNPLPELVSLDPDVATIASNGRVNRVSDGIVRIRAVTPYLTRGVDLDIYRENPGTADVFAGYVSGSLARECVDQVDNRLTAADPQTGKAIFSALDHTASSYIRNPACWAADVDLTGVAVWDSRHGARGGIAAIAADCAIGCEHYPIQTGDTIRWVTADGTVIERTVADKVNVGPSNASDSYATDWQLLLLDSDLPASIKPLKVLPADWAGYLPSLSMSYRLPLLMLDQQQHARIGDLRALGDFGYVMEPASPLRADYWEATADGDSGYQTCLIIGGEAVLVHTFTYAWGTGPALSANIDTINAAMTALGSSYQLSEISLTGYADYNLPDPAARYTFDGTPNDSSGNDLHGAEVGSPSWVDGVTGQSLRLDAPAGDYVSVPDDPTLDVRTTDFTICFWLRRADNTVTTAFRKKANKSDPNDAGWSFYVLSNNNHVLLIADGTNRTYWSTVFAITGDGGWHHIAYVLDRTAGVAHVYRDAVRIYASAGSDAGLSGVGDCRSIGTNLVIGTEKSADIDDLLIVQRALTADQIKGLYNDGRGNTE